MHFTYCPDPLSADLLQGDILKRTPRLEAVLQEVHPHYFSKPENRFFLVLTQSCDLVRRKSDACKARYISIVPIRPIDEVVERFLDSQRKTDLPEKALTADVQGRLRQFLEKLFNNNDPSYFFLRREPSRDFPDDCCAFLALSIAIRADLHYQTCMDAKILELEEIFKAKLGWLVGQMYSRVGTADWIKNDLDAEIAKLMEKISLWVPPKDYQELKRLIKEWKQNNNNQEPPIDVLADILGKMPKRKDRVVERLLKVVQDQGVLANEDVARKLGNALRSDTVLSSLISD